MLGFGRAIARWKLNISAKCSLPPQLKAAKGKGQIIEVLPSGKSKELTIYELGVRRDFTYHQVYTDGQYVYDPRLTSEPIPKGDWEIMMRSLNPGASFNSVKMR
jgi:filamentous hemagglutinin